MYRDTLEGAPQNLIERQANEFAAGLLMPRREIEVMTKIALDIEDASGLAYAVATRYGVSEKAAVATPPHPE